MIDCDDYVSLSDDDNVVEMTANPALERGNYVKSTDATETIVIDEDQPSTDFMKKNHWNSFIKTMRKIQREHSAFALFIDTCLDLENSDGMMRIIERTLIKVYENCDPDFKKSPQFLRCINKTISLLETDPDHKFSHIKSLVHTMNAKKVKKRVEFVTLTTNIKGKHTPGLVSKSKRKRISTNINNHLSIVIDSDGEQPDVPIINLDDTPSEIICLDDLEAEKENHRTENDLSNSQDKFLIPQEEVLYESSQETLTFVESEVLPIEYEPICNMPQSNVCELQQDTQILMKVKEFESRIDFLKKEITVLEETEVDNDSVMSPYVLCESYKAEVVEIYKQICNLIGETPVKKRKVRLKVLEGHPLGPVKRLEMFINNNIGDDGLPMFPDYSEVLKCVMVANLEDNMGWKKQQIMREANALFTQCGRALQQKRQKREYRDLLARLKTEHRDPADEDPELMMRLEQNRRTAVKKELDLLERYAQLQDLPQRSRSGSTFEQLSPTNLLPSTSNHVYQNGYYMSQSAEQYEPCSSTPPIQNHPPELNGIYKDVVMEATNVQIELASNIEPEKSCNGTVSDIQKDIVMEPICNTVQIASTSNREPEKSCNGTVSDIHKDIVMEPICITVQIDSTSNIEPEKPCNGNVSDIYKNIDMAPIGNTVQIASTSNREPENTCNGDAPDENESCGSIDEPPSPSDITLSDEDSNFEPPEIPLEIKEENLSDTNAPGTQNQNIVKKEIKYEPMDIIKMLEDIGDDYTTSVIDIEDPFLVIEISDSSDSEEEI